MWDFETMLEQYEEQAERLRTRISELSADITDSQKQGESGRAKSLCERRQTLYHELWEMEQSIESMREYIENAISRCRHSQLT